MHRVSPSVGSTRTNDMNNIRPFISDQNEYLTNNILFYSVLFFNLSKTISPNRNKTLDTFVIKRETSQYFEEPILKNENSKTPKQSSTKRTQRSIEDYMFKSSAKRLKK